MHTLYSINLLYHPSAFFIIRILNSFTMVDLQEWIRTRAQRIRNPSHRNPAMETESNKADKLELHLQQDNHKIWGWVIYRCTYSSDRDWEEFLSG
jgi:cytochrome c-type biogenesis protein CcmH/NrfG